MRLTPLCSGVPRPAVLAAVCTAFAVVATVGGGDLGGSALRAIAVLALLATAAALIRRPSGRPRQPPALVVEERHLLGKESGVAIVTMSGRRLLVGFGAHAVTLLDEANSSENEVTP